MDLAARRPHAAAPADIPISRDELPFVLAAALGIVVVAQVVDPGRPVDVALTAVGGVAMVASVFATRVPAELTALGVLIPTVVAVAHEGRLEPSLFLVCMTVVYQSWRLGSTTRAGIIVAACCLGVGLGSWAAPDDDRFSPVIWSAAFVFLFVLGRLLWRQRHLILELEAARRALADQAVADERRRIARELHDLAGHTLAATLLHVTGARHVLRRDPDEAERALEEAEAVGRDGLDQVRATVAALRTAESGVDPPLADGRSLTDLVARYRAAGITVHTDLDPTIEDLTGPAAVATQRIVGEALANVGRHAPDQQVDVRVAVGATAIDLTVRDRGRRPPAGSRAGFGLTGMTERARALGGEVTAGPDGDGWLVHARLPLDPRATSGPTSSIPPTGADR